MGTLADSAIVAGTLIFLLGVVWLTTAMHRSYQRRTPATITVLGLVVTNTGGILYPFGGINTQFGSTPVFAISSLLVLLGVLGLLVGIVWAVLSLRRSRRFYAPVVLSGLAIVAFLQASVLIVEQQQARPRYADPSAELERDVFQTAMETLMADQAIATLEPPPDNTAQNDFSALPRYTGGTVFLGGIYMRDVVTTFFYCWDKSGRITGQYESPQPCP